MKLINISREEQLYLQKLEVEILEEVNRICEKHNLHYTLAYGTLIGAIRHDGFIPWDDDIDISMLRADYIKFKEICKTELNSRFFYQSNDTDSEYFYLFDKIRLNNTIFKESFVSKYNIHHGVYIDIFPIDYIPSDTYKRKLQYYKFHFFRTGLMSKYLMLDARSGTKRIAATILKCLYCFFPLSFLYKKAHEVAMEYNNENSNYVINFFSPYRTREIFEKEVYMKHENHKFENKSFSVIKNYDLYLRQIYGDYMKLPPKEKQNTRHTITDLSL